MTGCYQGANLVAVTCYQTEKKDLFLCQQCHTLLELERHSMTDGAKCTGCGSNNVVKLNVSRKNGVIDESGPPPWEYVCHQCNTFFREPVPCGPDEAKNIKCPECGNKDVERFRVCCLEDIEHPFG